MHSEMQARALQSQLRLQGLSEACAAHPHGELHFYMVYLCPWLHVQFSTRHCKSRQVDASWRTS